jgi:hypothetical protein
MKSIAKRRGKHAAVETQTKEVGKTVLAPLDVEEKPVEEAPVAEPEAKPVEEKPFDETPAENETKPAEEEHEEAREAPEEPKEDVEAQVQKDLEKKEDDMPMSTGFLCGCA